jgi:hypothetical protein
MKDRDDVLFVIYMVLSTVMAVFMIHALMTLPGIP